MVLKGWELLTHATSKLNVPSKTSLNNKNLWRKNESKKAYVRWVVIMPLLKMSIIPSLPFAGVIDGSFELLLAFVGSIVEVMLSMRYCEMEVNELLLSSICIDVAWKDWFYFFKNSKWENLTFIEVEFTHLLMDMESKKSDLNINVRVSISDSIFLKSVSIPMGAADNLLQNKWKWWLVARQIEFKRLLNC